MKYSGKIVKLASKFEVKLRKYAQELSASTIFFTNIAGKQEQFIKSMGRVWKGAEVTEQDKQSNNPEDKITYVKTMGEGPIGILIAKAANDSQGEPVSMNLTGTADLANKNVYFTLDVEPESLKPAISTALDSLYKSIIGVTMQQRVDTINNQLKANNQSYQGIKPYTLPIQTMEV